MSRRMVGYCMMFSCDAPNCGWSISVSPNDRLLASNDRILARSRWTSTKDRAGHTLDFCPIHKREVSMP